MIIKYYSTDSTLTIIEDVTDIRVPANPAFGDYANDPWLVFDFDHDNDTPVMPPHPQKVISYAKDGPCMLKVYGVAYICNDEGKTIEKVYGGMLAGTSLAST